MNDDRVRALMEMAVAEAALSQAEKKRPDTPLVGAVLADQEGNVLGKSHRGEFVDDLGKPKGVHAEYVLLEKARNDGIDLRGKVLFTTLEPCTKRDPKKTPCAVRVAHTGLSTVYIGDLDPNPDVRGLGEAYVSLHTAVERFPSPFVKKLRTLNEHFWQRYRDGIIWTVSMWAAQGPSDDGKLTKPLLAREREPLLHQSLDLISRSRGEIWISAGDMSWLREVQIGLLRAALTNRKVRILCAPSGEKPIDPKLVQVMSSLGADVGVYDRGDWHIRATLAYQGDQRNMAFLEKGHGALYQTPEDEKLIGAVSFGYERCWRESRISPRSQPEVIAINNDELIDALHRGVPTYKDLKLSVEKVALDRVMFLPKALEQFKLFRIGQLQVLRQFFNLPHSFMIKGSPWPCTPPVIERLPTKQCVVVDGAHRVYWARQNGELEIEAIVVDNPKFNLPARPVADFDKLKPLPHKLARSQRYDDYEKNGPFRPFREALAALTQR